MCPNPFSHLPAHASSNINLLPVPVLELPACDAQVYLKFMRGEVSAHAGTETRVHRASSLRLGRAMSPLRCLACSFLDGVINTSWVHMVRCPSYAKAISMLPPLPSTLQLGTQLMLPLSRLMSSAMALLT